MLHNQVFIKRVSLLFIALILSLLLAFGLSLRAVQADAGDIIDFVIYSEDFEGGTGGYTVVDKGYANYTSWAYGTPTVVGPDSAHSGSNVWGTNLDGDYNIDEFGCMVSPDIDLSAYVDRELYLSWWQYLHCEGGVSSDLGFLDVSNNGGASWDRLHNIYDAGVREWSLESKPLDPSYVVSNFRVRFCFYSDHTVTYPGFYVDDVMITTPITLVGGYTEPVWPWALPVAAVVAGAIAAAALKRRAA